MRVNIHRIRSEHRQHCFHTSNGSYSTTWSCPPRPAKCKVPFHKRAVFCFRSLSFSWILFKSEPWGINFFVLLNLSEGDSAGDVTGDVCFLSRSVTWKRWVQAAGREKIPPFLLSSSSIVTEKHTVRSPVAISRKEEKNKRAETNAWSAMMPWHGSSEEKSTSTTRPGRPTFFCLVKRDDVVFLLEGETSHLIWFHPSFSQDPSKKEHETQSAHDVVFSNWTSIAQQFRDSSARNVWFNLEISSCWCWKCFYPCHWCCVRVSVWSVQQSTRRKSPCLRR